MPVGRTFSFEQDDEAALSPSEQERLHAQHTGYPVRDITSPPPQYSSPPPSEFVSPTPAAGRHQPQNQLDTTLIASNPYPNYPQRKAVPLRIANNQTVHDGEQYQEEDIPPPPPPHRTRIPAGNSDRDQDSENTYAYRTTSTVTPDMDNFGEAVQGGGLDRIAMNVADRNQRESGVEALRTVEVAAPRHSSSSQRDPIHSSPDVQMPARPLNTRGRERSSYGSNLPLAAGAATPGSITPVHSPNPRSSRYSGRSIQLDDYPSHPLPTGYSQYYDSPYLNAERVYDPAISDGSIINPYDIVDDGDDGFIPDPKRRSRLPSRRGSRRGSSERTGNSKPSSSHGSAIEGAAAVGAMGGIFGRRLKTQVSSGSYDPVRQGQAGDGPADPPEKDWLEEEKTGNKKMAWTVGLIIGAIIVLAITGGAVGGVLGTRGGSSSSSNSDNTAAGDTAANGDLGKDSPEIVALLNNPNLHKVFPGMDYTPWGTQYPLCLTYPPSQNNVTRDMAVLSQLTNAVRLYGTDCNQTEMVLHAIDRLQLTDMKVWLGVWIDTNQTTTDRQIAQMYKILRDTEETSIFKGAIIGNEALYREGDTASSEDSLIQIITDVKSNFTSLGYKMPVGTSDLGDNWNGQLVEACDMVMSNIHPFFAGVTAEVAAAWTWDFWDTHDRVLTGAGTGTDDGKMQIISETGWPSGGGTDCGGATGECTPGQSGSIAGIDQMNTYLDTWVCQALANGTDYFWFEAFDEPWKVIYNTATQQWEDKWGLMDPGRNLKTGVKIPDCGGATVK